MKENLESNIQIYMNDIRNIPVLSKEEEIALAKEIAKNNPKAREKFIKSNLRLIISIAKKYAKGDTFLLSEFISAGNIGLIRAVDKFDVEKGYKFSTYATIWIRQSILRTIPTITRNLTIPGNIIDKLKKLDQIYNELEIKLFRKPKLDEIAEKMNISVKEVSELYLIKQDTISLNTSVGEDEDEELMNLIEDTEISIDKNYFTEELKKNLFDLLDKIPRLSDIEKKVIIYRFGLIDGTDRTLSSIGEEFGITREGVRQIEAKVLYKLRFSPLTEVLCSLTDNPENAKKYLRAIRMSRYFYENKNKDNKKKKNHRKNIKTIYKKFSNYSENEINEAVKKLNDGYKTLLFARFGGDLKNPDPVPFTERQRRLYYSNILKSLKSILNGTNEKQPRKKHEYNFDNYINRTDCIELLKQINTPYFINLLNQHNYTQAVIILLKSGKVFGKEFTNDAVKNLLKNMESEFVDSLDIKKIR